MWKLRRSVHFVPGANEKMFRKALELPADGLILDLEDAVTPDNKESARETVRSWLADVDFGRQERLVRMNPLDTPWGVRDLEVTMTARPDAYVVPKVCDRQDLVRIDQMLSRIEADRGYPPGGVTLLVIATETPQGPAKCPRNCRSAPCRWADVGCGGSLCRDRGQAAIATRTATISRSSGLPGT